MKKKTILGKCIAPNFNKLPLTEYYQSLPNPRFVTKGSLTPRLIFLYAIADVTGKSIQSIRRWTAGTVIPTELEMDVIADVLKTSKEILFPNINKASHEK